MALTLTATNRPQRVTLTGTVVHLLTLPAATDYLVIRPIADELYLTVGVADGAAKGDDYETYDADVRFSRAIGGGSIGIAGTNLAVVEITPMAKGF